jgi:hypothetical protein
MADRISHREYGQAEGEGNAEETDTDLGKTGSEHGASASTKDQPESSECLCGCTFSETHANPPDRNQPITEFSEMNRVFRRASCESSLIQTATAIQYCHND